jgi:hypothetical protein
MLMRWKTLSYLLGKSILADIRKKGKGDLFFKKIFLKPMEK